MIEKKVVRGMLAELEAKLKEEAKTISKDIREADAACDNSLVRNAWLSSAERELMMTKFWAIEELRGEIIDMRCSKMLND